MAAATKLLTSGGGGVILTPASSIASDVTVNIQSVAGTLPVANTAGTFTTANFNSASTFGFRNRIINGAMGIWQRGTSGFTTNGNYCADRWVAAGTLTAVTQSSDVPNTSFRYSLTNTGSNFQWIGQRIESYNCTDLVGQSVTISFWLKQTSGAGTNALQIALFNTATQDNWASPVNFNTTTFTSTSSWAYYSFTVNSLPSNCSNGIQFIIQTTVAGSTTFFVTGVQLEVGAVATGFDWRPYGTELALCQRYYQSYNSSTNSTQPFGSGCGYNATTAQFFIPFQVQMRSAPSLAFSAVGTFSNYNFPAPSVIGSNLAGVNGAQVFTNFSTSTNTNASMLVANSTTSAYINFTAEL